jgi:hypothetical protein
MAKIYIRLNFIKLMEDRDIRTPIYKHSNNFEIKLFQLLLLLRIVRPGNQRETIGIVDCASAKCQENARVLTILLSNINFKIIK